VPGTYTDYVTVSDNTNAISVDVPVEWSDLDGEPRDSGPSIVAAVDAAGFLQSYDVPGVEVTASREAAAGDIDALLDEIGAGDDCTETLPREDYSDPLYTGRFQAYDGCGESGAGYVVVAATPAEGDYVVLVLVNIVSDADLDALDHILDTFVVTGEV
jgi:serine protease Do